MKPDNVTIILNSGSGRQDGEARRESIEDRFKHHGIKAKFVAFEPNSDLAKIAKDTAEKDPNTAIIAAGGDGTICGVAAGLRGQPNQMGIIPSGTFNYFARSLNIPETVDEAVDVIAAGLTRDTDIGMINDRVFLNNASIGAYPAILQTREGVYEKWGRSRIAAYWSVAKALARFRSPLKLNITVDGKSFKHRTSLVFAITNAFQLREMGLNGEECIENGGMVLLIAPDTNRWKLFKHAASLALGIAKPETDYEMHCGNDIDLDLRSQARPVACDGELSRMKGPFKLRMQRKALTLIVPAGSETAVR
jgi:YegS/Rv2252/BmrU family lipid kinase